MTAAPVQVNLFQKLTTSAEHVVYQNCSECQNKTKTTICVHNMFCRYSELTIFMKNEQSVVILWVNWCKNKSFWQRFTRTEESPNILEVTKMEISPVCKEEKRLFKCVTCDESFSQKYALDKHFESIHKFKGHIIIQVNLCQKLLFLHQLTHNMTTDCSLNYKFNTWKFQAQTWGEHVVYRNCFWHSEQFLYTTCSPHVLQKEELLTKIYLYLYIREAKSLLL